MAHSHRELLIVELAGQRLGLPCGLVRELLRAVLITPLPRSDRFVEGVINVRGQIVPVLDLRSWLGMPVKAVEPADHLVIVQFEQESAAIRVDHAVEIAKLEADSSAGGADRAVIRPGGAVVLLPDLAPLLAHARAFLQSEATTGAAAMELPKEAS